MCCLVPPLPEKSLFIFTRISFEDEEIIIFRKLLMWNWFIATTLSVLQIWRHVQESAAQGPFWQIGYLPEVRGVYLADDLVEQNPRWDIRRSGFSRLGRLPFLRGLAGFCVKEILTLPRNELSFSSFLFAGDGVLKIHVGGFLCCSFQETLGENKKKDLI